MTTPDVSSVPGRCYQCQLEWSKVRNWELVEFSDYESDQTGYMLDLPTH